MEFEDKLLRKLKFASTDAHAARTLLESRMEIVTPTALAEGVCRDSDDDWILATAIEGNCECIVTGDQDLLILNAHAGMRIMRPAAFWQYELTRDS